MDMKKKWEQPITEEVDMQDLPEYLQWIKKGNNNEKDKSTKSTTEGKTEDTEEEYIPIRSY